jgi:hypothetical protein
MTVIWRPAFMAAHGKQSGFSVLKDRGNTLTLVRDGRVEWNLKKAGLAREIQRLTAGGKKTDDRSEMDLTAERDGKDGQSEQDRRDSFAKGVSIEGEFAFVRAVSNFGKKGVRDGRYKGNYSFNVKRQMEMRELIEQKGNKSSSVSMCIVGGSQMGRLAKEISSGDGTGLKVVGEVRVKGRLEENVVEIALEELAQMAEQPEKVLIGGPTNSLVEHGTGETHGFGPERKVRVRVNKTTGETEWETRFHLSRPRKIGMVERRDLVDRTVRLIRGAQATFPWAEVSYVTMFPRHVEPCCEKHMTQEDVWVMDSVRRDVDRDIVDMLGDGDDGVSVIEWWDILGFEKDMTVKEMQRMGFVSDDGVHLTRRANRCAAASLCIRYRGEDERWREREQMEEQRKRRRLM